MICMETLRIEIVNPKAKKLWQDLADMNLISISATSSSRSDFKKLILKMRSKSHSIPTLEEITKEVEEVRQLRYERKAK